MNAIAFMILNSSGTQFNSALAAKETIETSKPYKNMAEEAEIEKPASTPASPTNMPASAR
jgi:hypothetical protein